MEKSSNYYVYGLFEADGEEACAKMKLAWIRRRERLQLEYDQYISSQRGI